MLMKCSECGKPVSDTAKTCPNCGAPVNKTKTKEVTLLIEYKDGKSIRSTDQFHVLVDGVPIGLATFNTPFKFRISQTCTLSIKVKGFMEFRSSPVSIEYGKVSSVKYSVSFSSFGSTKYELKEIK